MSEPLAALRALGDATKAAEMAAYHKAERVYLGVSNPQIDALCRDWRAGMELDTRVATAHALWQSDIHEARVAAAKLLTQARMRPSDEPAWQEILTWVPQFDAWAIADHAASAGSRRLVADPSRIDSVEGWTQDGNFWVRRAALTMTLPWTKQRHPSAEDQAIRERVLGWAAAYVPDHGWFIQKAIAWWLRDLSKRDPDRVRAFLADHGDGMKPFAQREAARLLPDG
ncbi:DNA alkylation repair protein [Oceanomicrobium pacificus]|uniref:DNA alkylation repair protein n=1 Tax=Oceanomicrobium pacificus TaxID=2692916 RepID=A0A6B0TRE9_9RHOB|nr:DNA alkylation repair protein [Oceanomicrobium pacificus]MXU66526.1 DNA alkylation repair protein [Oceanomicrobium pacificus]